MENTHVILSEVLLDEMLGRLKQKALAPYRWLRLVRLRLEKTCRVVELGQLPAVVRDPKDNHVLAAAAEGGCDYIISGDKDLLEIGQYKGIIILSPADFLEHVHK